MKKLYIIEVDESEIVECWNEQAAKEIGYQEYALKQYPGIKVKPYNYSGDCISREALKKAIEEVKDNYDGYEPNDLGKFMCKVDDLIDNAQAVEITEEMAINKLHETGWLIGHDKEMTTRPQGEWLFKHNSSDIWCSVCDENFDEIPQAFNFCPNCGADMRKGGAE